MLLPVDDIIPLIPQKPPFVMVGRLLYADAVITRSSFVIHQDNVFVRDGIFQEAGLMENIAQTAALQAGYMAQANNEPVETGYIGAIKDFEVFTLPVVGDEITTEITIDNQVFNVTMLTGSVWRDDVLLARCEMKVFIGN